jgi:hypothetical protein
VVKKRAARSCADAAPCEGDGPVQNDLLFDFWLDTSYDKDVDLTLGGPHEHIACFKLEAQP